MLLLAQFQSTANKTLLLNLTSKHLILQIQQLEHQNNIRNLFKVNTRTPTLISVLIVNLIVTCNFKQRNARGVVSLYLKTKSKTQKRFNFVCRYL